MCATFNGNFCTIIASCSSPTNTSGEKVIITLYDRLFFLVCSIPKHNLLIIGGNMNTQKGKNKNNKFCLYPYPNRNGEFLTDFSPENSLSCVTTKSSKKEKKLWTFTYPSNAKAQLDYIPMYKKWITSALNCEAYSSFGGVSFDHRIVSAKIRRNKK